MFASCPSKPVIDLRVDEVAGATIALLIHLSDDSSVALEVNKEADDADDGISVGSVGTFGEEDRGLSSNLSEDALPGLNR